MLVQELGWSVSLQDAFITGHWDVSGRKVQLVFHVDSDDGTVYASTRFDAARDDEHVNNALLHENLHRAFIKFCKDADGNIILLAELPPQPQPAALREAVYRVCKAAAWYLDRAGTQPG